MIIYLFTSLGVSAGAASGRMISPCHNPTLKKSPVADPLFPHKVNAMDPGFAAQTGFMLFMVINACLIVSDDYGKIE